MNQCNFAPRDYFLLLLRTFFGTWLLYLGISKWIFVGSTNFVSYITTEFNATWSPPSFNLAIAWIILIAEPLLGALLLLGKKLRCVWTLTALLMFVLMMGQSVLQKFDVVANNWIYLFISLVAAALSEEPTAKPRVDQIRSL